MRCHNVGFRNNLGGCISGRRQSLWLWSRRSNSASIILRTISSNCIRSSICCKPSCCRRLKLSSDCCFIFLFSSLRQPTLKEKKAADRLVFYHHISAHKVTYLTKKKHCKINQKSCDIVHSSFLDSCNIIHDTYINHLYTKELEVTYSHLSRIAHF